MVMSFVVFFFKQKTAYEMRISDWSSDVCSSDLTIQQVRCHAPDLTTIGSIFLRAHQRPQAQRLHQALHSLVIDHITSLAQRHRNTSIAVAALDRKSVV